MSRPRQVALLVATAIVAAALLPGWLGGGDLDRVATALALAGPAVGAAITLAAGRPNLAIGALAGVAAYASGGLALRGVDVPLAIAVATAASGGLGAAVAVGTARLDGVALLAATLLLAVLLGAAGQALPALSGGQAGLGPLPGFGTVLPGGRLLELTPAGDLHAALAAALAVAVVGVLLLGGLTGARLRAVGSDRARSSASGLRPLQAEILAFAAGSAVAGFGGALAAHLNGVATPDAFSPDVVALPLLAALVAGRGSAVGAVAAAVGTGLLGSLVLPDLGWRGPPSAGGAALGLLAVAVVATLLPGYAARRRHETSATAADASWPFSRGEFAGATLVVQGLDVAAGALRLVSNLSLRADAGRIHGLVGPNGAGKSTLLAALARPRSPAVRLEGGSGPVVLQPQGGGGFAACTVDETLVLAARGGGRTWSEASRAAALWRERLALDSARSSLCADLGGGRRRLLDLARVLLRRPAVLLCDEPLAGLDPATRASAVSLLQAAAEAGLTIILAEHDRGAVAALAAATTEIGGTIGDRTAAGGSP